MLFAKYGLTGCNMRITHKPGHLLLSIPSPSPETPHLRISAEGDELIAYFGQAHFHVGRKTADTSEQLEARITMLSPIFEEELIAVEFGSWFGFVAGGFVNKKQLSTLHDSHPFTGIPPSL